LTTVSEALKPAEVGDRVWWQIYRTSTRGYGRVTAITDHQIAAWPQERLQYHIVDDEGMLRLIPAVYVHKYQQPTQRKPKSVNPLDKKRCKCCSVLMQSGLQDSIHPHHDKDCELYPDNAWRGYVLVKLGECNQKIGYHSEPHHRCVEYFNQEHNL
jgi:hypothetical protein